MTSAAGADGFWLVGGDSGEDGGYNGEDEFVLNDPDENPALRILNMLPIERRLDTQTSAKKPSVKELLRVALAMKFPDYAGTYENIGLSNITVPFDYEGGDVIFQYGPYWVEYIPIRLYRRSRISEKFYFLRIHMATATEPRMILHKFIIGRSDRIW